MHSKPKYQLRPEFLPEPKLCQVCKTTPTVGRRKRCNSCSREYRRIKNKAKRNTRKNRKSTIKDLCSICSFVPKHSCQMDVDHIDGDKMNNDPKNLQVLCANCHRLKTQLNKDYKTREERSLGRRRIMATSDKG